MIKNIFYVHFKKQLDDLFECFAKVSSLSLLEFVNLNMEVEFPHSDVINGRCEEDFRWAFVFKYDVIKTAAVLEKFLTYNITELDKSMTALKISELVHRNIEMSGIAGEIENKHARCSTETGRAMLKKLFDVVEASFVSNLKTKSTVAHHI